jgi:hypothetical protein
MYCMKEATTTIYTWVENVVDRRGGDGRHKQPKHLTRKELGCLILFSQDE